MLRQIYYKFLAILYRLYWFIFRPETFGVKCVVESGGEILMIRNNYGYKRWTFPGGSIERKETPENAAKREVQEEVGLVVQNIKSIGRFTSTAEYKKDSIFCFSGKADKKDYVIQEAEILEAKWFLPENLPTPLSPIAEKVFNFWKEASSTLIK